MAAALIDFSRKFALFIFVSPTDTRRADLSADKPRRKKASDAAERGKSGVAISRRRRGINSRFLRVASNVGKEGCARAEIISSTAINRLRRPPRELSSVFELRISKADESFNLNFHPAPTSRNIERRHPLSDLFSFPPGLPSIFFLASSFFRTRGSLLFDLGASTFHSARLSIFRISSIRAFDLTISFFQLYYYRDVD